MQLTRASNGRAVVLDSASPLATSGEGRIFAVSGESSVVAKMYHQRTPTRSAKLRCMIANPPRDPTEAQNHVSIAWPLDLLHAFGNPQTIAGFLMPRILGGHPISSYYNPKSRRRLSPLFSYRYLLRTAHNLAATFAAVHARGHVIGDVNESNILVADRALVTLVDTDSFQVTDHVAGVIYRCPVGRAEFTPPELQGKHFPDVTRGVEQDLFGLATVIFLLLMEGVHPFEGVFTGRGEPAPIEVRIAKGYFPHGAKPHVPYAPNPTTPAFATLHPELKKLFLYAFVAGHRDPSARPDARSWQTLLTHVEDHLVVCGQNEQHLFADHLSTCPWCERRRLLHGHDPFPSARDLARQHVPVQIPLPRPASPRTAAPSTARTLRSPVPTSLPPSPSLPTLYKRGSRKRATAAVLLSTFAPGFAQVFAGEASRGAWIYGGVLLVWFGGLFAMSRVDRPPHNVALPVLLIAAMHLFVIIDSWKVTRRTVLVPKWYNRWFIYALLIPIPIGVTTLSRALYVQAVRLAGPGMQNTLLPGDFCLVDKTAYRQPLSQPQYPRRGDLVAFSAGAGSASDWISRCVGLPYDTLQVQDGKLFVNGSPLFEPPTLRHAELAGAPDRLEWGPFYVPQGHFAVMGDDRGVGIRSGVPLEFLRGKVVAVYFSSDPATGRIRWNRIGLHPLDLEAVIQDSVDASMKAANAFLSSDRFDDARHIYQRVLQLGPWLADAQLGLGHAWYYGMFQFDSAFSAYQRAQAAAPNDALTNYFLGKLLTIQGRYTEALPYLLRAKRVDPHVSGIVSRTKGRRAGLYESLGLCYLATGKYPDAHSQWDEVKNHGGIPDALAEWGRNLLSGLPPNTILIVNGDDDTFSLLYLQENGVRSDVRIVNRGLLNCNWYVKYLRDVDPRVPIRWTDSEIDSRTTQSWPQPKPVRAAGLSWQLGPPPGTDYLRLEDIALYFIIDSNAWNKPIYFSTTTEYNLNLDSYLCLEGLAWRLRSADDSECDVAKALDNMTRVYSYDHIDDDDLLTLRVGILQSYSYAVLKLASELATSDPEQCGRVLEWSGERKLLRSKDSYSIAAGIAESVDRRDLARRLRLSGGGTR